MDRHLDGRVEAQIYLKDKQRYTIHMQTSDKKITKTSSSREERSFCSLLDLLLSSGGCRYIQNNASSERCADQAQLTCA